QCFRILLRGWKGIRRNRLLQLVGRQQHKVRLESVARSDIGRECARKAKIRGLIGFENDVPALNVSPDVAAPISLHERNEVLHREAISPADVDASQESDV